MSASLERTIAVLRDRVTPFRMGELSSVVGDSRETWWRRCMKGTRGVKLKYFRTGCHIKVHPADLIEFLLAINGEAGGSPSAAPIPSPTPATDKRSAHVECEAAEVARMFGKS